MIYLMKRTLSKLHKSEKKMFILNLIKLIVQKYTIGFIPIPALVSAI